MLFRLRDQFRLCVRRCICFFFQDHLHAIWIRYNWEFIHTVFVPCLCTGRTHSARTSKNCCNNPRWISNCERDRESTEKAPRNRLHQICRLVQNYLLLLLGFLANTLMASSGWRHLRWTQKEEDSIAFFEFHISACWPGTRICELQSIHRLLPHFGTCRAPRCRDIGQCVPVPSS